MWRSTTTLLHLVRGGGADRGRPTPNWCVWPWPRCCSGSTASTAGSALPTAGWATCSATCPTPARLPQAAAGRRATAGPAQASQPPGPGQPVVVRQPAADRRHAAAVWGLAGDGQPLGHRRNRRIRVCASHTRYYWGLKLYLVTAPDGMPVTWCLAD